jgi:hypothetical protein
VDDLLVTLGVLVMIEQQAVFWACSVYQPPTPAVYFTVIVSNQTLIWYLHRSFSCSLCIVTDALSLFLRLARGSILASVIRILPDGPLRVGALYVSGLFALFYVVILAQFIWLCEMNIEPNSAG